MRATSTAGPGAAPLPGQALMNGAHGKFLSLWSSSHLRCSGPYVPSLTASVARSLDVAPNIEPFQNKGVANARYFPSPLSS